ncbi:MAG: endonuclease/exonuclease/phosphatase family protein [Thermogutta sp.]
MRKNLVSACFFGFITWISLMLGSCWVVAEGPELRVMSFNIRYGTAPDGENHWDRRKDFLVETILAFRPDFLGTQETLAFQRDFLAEKLPDYGCLGVGREDGKEQGEIMAIYWRKDRFEVLDFGHFWLSTTPEVPGSKSWDSALPRMVTWIKLRDLRQPDARPILWMNTHFDHRGEQARQESARLLRAKLSEMGAGCSLIVTGDFNAGEGSQPYQLFFGEVEGVTSPVVDSFRTAHPQRGAEEGTFSGFRAENVTGARIDWIACSRDWKIIAAGIDHTSRDGRTPSDHFPVFAILAR